MLDLAGLMESCLSVCTMHANELKGLIMLHGLQVLQLSSGIEQLDKLVDSVRRLCVPKCYFFLKVTKPFFGDL